MARPWWYDVPSVLKKVDWVEEFLKKNNAGCGFYRDERDQYKRALVPKKSGGWQRMGEMAHLKWAVKGATNG